MKKILAAAALLGSASAQAGFITVDGIAPIQDTIAVVANNDFGDSLSALGVTNYTFGASLGVTTNGFVTYYYYGKEAGYNNTFYAGDLSYTTGFTPTEQNYFGAPVEIGTVAVDAGVLGFEFCTQDYGLNNLGCISNAQNDGTELNSVRSIALNVSDSTAWLFWDDSGGGPDDNHDDMLVKAVFTPSYAVPEPGTLGLLGMGLLAVAGSRRFRKSQQN